MRICGSCKFNKNFGPLIENLQIAERYSVRKLPPTVEGAYLRHFLIPKIGGFAILGTYSICGPPSVMKEYFKSHESFTGTYLVHILA